jgi:hypothetical protein
MTTNAAKTTCKSVGYDIPIILSKHICNPPPPPIYCGVCPSIPLYIVVYGTK